MEVGSRQHQGGCRHSHRRGHPCFGPLYRPHSKPAVYERLVLLDSKMPRLQSGYFYGSIVPYDETKPQGQLRGQWSYVVDLDKNEFRTFQGGKEIHFWRFPLDAIPLGTFTDTSILAFNRIADGNDFDYHDSGNDVVDAYKRFFEEAKTKEKEEDEKKKAAEKNDGNNIRETNDDNPKAAKMQKSG